MEQTQFKFWFHKITIYCVLHVSREKKFLHKYILNSLAFFTITLMLFESKVENIRL